VSNPAPGSHRMLHPFAFLALAALSAQAPRDAAQGSASEGWRDLPLPSLAYEGERSAPMSALLNGRHLRMNDEEWEGNALGRANHLPLPALTGLLMEDATRARRTLRIEPGGPPILARGTDEALAAAAALCADLDRQGRALEIELAVWLTAGAARVGTHPSRAVFEAAVDGATPLGTAHLRSGSVTALGVRRSVGFVAGYEAQIAAGSGVAGPRIGHVSAGHTLHLRASRARDGRLLVLEGLLDLSELEGIAEFDPGTHDLGRLQQPTVGIAQIAFAGAVANGGVLCVSVSGAALTQPAWTLWIEARCPVAEPAAGAGAWRLRDLALLEAPVVELPMPVPGSGFDAPPRERAQRTLLRSLSAAEVAQAADAAHSTGGRGGRTPIVWSGGLVLAPADETALWREIDSLIAAAEGEHLRAADVTVRFGDALVQLPVLEGRPARVLLGRERAVLVGYGLQVAQDTWMPEPRVESVFDGVLVQTELVRGRLQGDAWRAASAPSAVLERDAVALARLATHDRRLASGPVALEADSAGRVVLPESGPDAALHVALESRPDGS
jgi:hypothetical protein